MPRFAIELDFKQRKNLIATVKIGKIIPYEDSKRKYDHLEKYLKWGELFQHYVSRRCTELMDAKDKKNVAKFL